MAAERSVCLIREQYKPKLEVEEEMSTPVREELFLKSCEKFMKPEELKTNLARASAFLAAYELLKSSIVNKPRGFFILHHTYKTEVVSLKRKDHFRASCLWFLKLGAISEQDIRVIEDIRHHRNRLPINYRTTFWRQSMR